MNKCTKTELSPAVKMQQRLINVIQYKATQVYEMESCKDKQVEETILDFLIILQIITSRYLK